MEVRTEPEVDRPVDGEATEDSVSATDPPSTFRQEKPEADGSSESPSLNQGEMLRALATVEKDSLAIAESFSSLFSSLRSALSEATGSSVDHMRCFGDAAGRLQETALDAATKGNRYINSCLRLNEEIKGIENLAAQLKFLRRNVDALDTAVNKLVRPP